MAAPSCSVRGPAGVEHGFIADFLARTALHDTLTYLPGDRLQLPLSSPAFRIDPVELRCIPPSQNRPPSDPAHQQHHHQHSDEHDAICAYMTTVTLHPHPPLSPSSRAAAGVVEFAVDGLVDHTGATAALSTHPSHRYARHIVHDRIAGTVSLVIYIIEYDYLRTHSQRDASRIYLAHDSLYRAERLDSPLFADIFAKYSTMPVEEGVFYADNLVPPPLTAQLSALIDGLAAAQVPDYHPHSNECVRDLLHPSLFAYVRGLTAVTPSAEQKLNRISNAFAEMHPNAVDRWGRQYQLSKYQWLPTIFNAADGAVTIEGDINNLDRVKYAQLYQALEKLFAIMLPHFQHVLAYANAVDIIPTEGDGDEFEYYEVDSDHEYEPDMHAARLRGKKLKVITKIVQYEFKSHDDVVDGVFHVEGMSSDHIVMTGVYVLERDEQVQGGELQFKRVFWGHEAAHIFLNIPQCRPWIAERVVEEKVLPLGKLETPQGRIILFPNSHIHKLSSMTRKKTSASGAAAADGHSKKHMVKRRVIVFWVVDPEADVLTTDDVPNQQRVMSLQEAKQHRLQLMEERSIYKGKMNGLRKISLCEH